MESVGQALYIFLSALYVLFFPGLFLSLIFFKLGTIDILERIALSFALSLAVVPLIVFYTNILGFGISPFTVMLQIFLLLLVSWIIIVIRLLRHHEQD